MGSSPINTNASPKKKKRKMINVKRGPTRMKHIVRARNNNVVFPVKWNHRGQPVGKNSTKMSSYIGTTTRSTVPINIKDWTEVPDVRKDSIWEDVQLTFNLPAEKKDFIKNQAGTMWRNFKSFLTREWIFRNGKINNEPPKKYSFIELDHWRDFVASRLTEEFRVKSETNRRAGHENKYVQKRSRKGCARLEHEELEKMGDNATSISRAVMWKLMRTSATSGKMSPEAQEVADQIDSLTERSRQGEFQDSGRNDVLARALGKEHGGRVRGVGLGVNNTDYFGSLGNPKQTRDEIRELKLIVNELAREVVDLRNQQQKSVKSSVPTHDNIQPDINSNSNQNDHIPEGRTSCKLALSDPAYRIVAVGKVHNVREEESHLLLGKPWLDDEVRVSIEYALEEGALLPISTDELCTVGEAIGNHVVWPTHLVVIEKTLGKLKDKGKQQVSSSTEKARNASMEKNKNGEATFFEEACNMQENARCKLVLEDPEYRIVATGNIHISRILHGKPLLPDEVRVSIDNVLEDGAPLPTPLEDEAYTVGEAVGTHVAWPKHLVLVDKTSTLRSKDKGKSCVSSTKANLGSTPTTLPKSADKEKRSESPKQFQKEPAIADVTKLSSDPVVDLIRLPKELRVVYMYVRKMAKDEQIKILVEHTVLNHAQDIFIGKEEMLQVIRQQQIGACHICVYILKLFHQCRLSGKTKTYGFLCPATISLLTMNKEENIRENHVARIKYLVQSLNAKASKGKIFFAPYNAGCHWILCVIDPYADVVYYFDSLSATGRPIVADIRNVIDTALRIFRNAKLLDGCKKVKNNTSWKCIKCPQQENDVDCGYFVLRFMKDVIDRNLTIIPDEFVSTNGWPTYIQSQLDEIKIELAQYILDHEALS